MAELDKESFIQELKKLSFNLPITLIYVIVGNPEYDIKSYSEELDKSHNEWNYLDHDGHDGPMQYQEYDESGYYIKEDKEHKIWRLNHNKKYDKMKMVVTVMPKRDNDNLYKLDDKAINEIIDNFKQYTVYSVFK